MTICKYSMITAICQPKKQLKVVKKQLQSKKFERMNNMRTIKKDELKYIYDDLMSIHFPQDEIKPWKKISALWDEGKYHGYIWEDEQGEIIGYALLFEGPDNYWLLDYYAVNSKERNKGYGSRFIKELHKELKDKMAGIILETENPAYGKDEAEKNLRERRINFYLRNGGEKSGVLSTAEGVEYVILYLSGQKTCQKETIAEYLAKIYDLVLPKDGGIKVWVE